MTINSIWFVLGNSTTVDNLTRQARVYQFAVLMSKSEGGRSSSAYGNDQNGSASSNFASGTQYVDSPDSEQPPPFATISYPSVDRKYAILSAPAGCNPYDLKSPLANVKNVMGDSWYDWLFPLKLSPCSSRRLSKSGDESGSGGTSMYKFGPVMDEIRADAGLTVDERPVSSSAAR